jgi:hypothetical protein
VTQVASLGVFIDLISAILCGREHDAALFVKDANSVDTLFECDCSHDFVRSIALVREHRVPCRACKGTRKLVSADDHGGLKKFFLLLYAEPT